MKILVFPFILFSLIFGCSSSKQEADTETSDKDFSYTYNTEKDSLVSIYSAALEEYLKAMREKRQVTFDTLFLGKHEEFPDIKLPAKIENTGIVVLTTEEANSKFAYRKSMAFVNMVDLGDKGKDEFMFVTFYVDNEKEKVNYWPQHNCLINLVYNKNKKEFDLEKVNFDFPYPSSGLKSGV
jgi:hypothetical protein